MLRAPINPMPDTESDKRIHAGGYAWFPTTHWSVVISAGDSDSQAASAALESLCQTYWYPLYAYIRRRGHDSHQAEDLTQGFFAQFLSGNHFARAEREKGKLRSYLLGALKHYLADAADHGKRLKRGGGQAPISLDVLTGEERYLAEPADERSPDRLFERRWALTVLDRVLARLKEDYDRGGNILLFARIKPFLISKAGLGSYSEIASDLGMTEGAVGVAVHRLRKRYGQLFREEIANTVANPLEIETEIRHLAAVLST